MPTIAPVERVPATGVVVGDAVDDEVEVGGAVVDEGAAEDGAVLGDDEVGKLTRALIVTGVALHTSCTVLPSL